MSPVLRATLLTLASMLFFTLETVVAKAAADIPLATVAFARAFGGLVWCLPALLRDPGIVRTRHLGLNLLRGGLSGLSWVFYFSAFALLPLATATVLSFTSVLFVILLAAPILKERVSAPRWIAALAGFAGVLVIVRPGVLPVGWPVLASLGSALCSAGIVLTTKALSRTERTTTIMLYIGLVTTALWAPFALPGLAWPGWAGFGLLVAMGLCGPCGMHLWINALRQVDASALVGLRYTQLLFAAFFGVVLFGEVPDAWLLAGAVLIIGSAAYITRVESRKPARASAASSGDGSSPKAR
jgi:drug/metabolite transporter (DMT)-like permease